MDTRMRGYDKYRVTPDLIGGPYPVPRHPRLDRASMPPELSPPTRSGVQLLVVLDTRMRGYDRPFVMPPKLSPPTRSGVHTLNIVTPDSIGGPCI
jgi:hypothetical protein